MRHCGRAVSRASRDQHGQASLEAEIGGLGVPSLLLKSPGHARETKLADGRWWDASAWVSSSMELLPRMFSCYGQSTGSGR